jgi:hypothetical protein
MKQNVQKTIAGTERLGRQLWLIRLRAIRAVEGSKTSTDRIRENIQPQREEKERLKKDSEYRLF